MDEIEEWGTIEEAPNYVVSKSGKVRLRDGGQILSVHMYQGHPTVNLFMDNTYRKRRVDRLVAQTFYGETIEPLPRGRPKQRRFIMDRESFEQTEIY